MRLKPVELPMWHLAWCFSKASMVHSAQSTNVVAMSKMAPLNGLHLVGYLLGFQSLAAMQGCWQPAPGLAASDWKHQVAGAWPTCAVPWWQLWVIWRWRAEWQPSLFGVAQPGHRLGHPPSHPTSLYGANPAFNPVALGGKKGSFQWAGIKSSPWLVAQRSAVASSLWLGFGHMAVDESLWVVPICPTGKLSLHASMENTCTKVCLPWYGACVIYAKKCLWAFDAISIP